LIQASESASVYVRHTSKPLNKAVGISLENHIGQMKDEIRFVGLCSLSWTHDSQGFFYQVVYIDLGKSLTIIDFTSCISVVSLPRETRWYENILPQDRHASV